MGQDRDDFKEVVSAASPLAAVTITCGLGERRQMNMAINISCADPLEVQNEMLDRAMLLLDRQQARYDLEEHEKNFTVVGLNTRNLLSGIPVAENVLKNQIASLRARLEGQVEARDDFQKEEVDKWNASKRGAYKASGHVQSKFGAMDAEIQKTKDALDAAPKDAEQERAKLKNTIARNQEDLRIRRQHINDLRRLAGLSENTEFMDAEIAKV